MPNSGSTGKRVGFGSPVSDPSSGGSGSTGWVAISRCGGGPGSEKTLGAERVVGFGALRFPVIRNAAVFVGQGVRVVVVVRRREPVVELRRLGLGRVQAGVEVVRDHRGLPLV